MSFLYSRRRALWLSGGLLVACGGTRARTVPDASTGAPPSAKSCTETHDNIEGPYYRAGAPERNVLAGEGVPGTPLVIAGRVTGADCTRGLAGVELDVWHATHDGHYDNDGTMRVAASQFLLRGRVRTDADGRYRVTTIVPGRYLNGKQYRPAHVHVKLRSAGLAPLTTQLYFPDDPYNAVDPFIHPSLVMGVEKDAESSRGGLRGRFDFVLRSA